MAGWSWLDERERPVLEWLGGLRGTAFDDVMRDLSHGPPRVLVCSLATLFACARLRSFRPLPAVLGALLLAQIASDAIKGVSDRPRPPVAFPAIHALGALPANGSFPSTHATTAAAVAAALWWSARPFSPALAACAALVGLSRVWLGVHYPSDVIAGFALGAAIGLLCAFVTRTASGPLRVPRSRSRPPPQP